MIDIGLYTAAKAAGKITTVFSGAEFEVTFTLTDNLGNALAPTVQSASIADIQNLINLITEDVTRQQTMVTQAQTVLTNAQALLTDAQGAATAAGISLTSPTTSTLRI